MTLDEIAKEIDDDNDIIVHCDTEEKAVALLTMCKDKGFRWPINKEIFVNDGCGGDGVNWEEFRENTIYYIFVSRGRTLKYDDISYAEKESDKYVEYDDT